METNAFGPKFRRAGIRGRRKILGDSGKHLWTSGDLAATSADDEILDIADIMIENAVGVVPVPMGIATGFLIDGEQMNIPIAIEEPSVIAAASFAAALIAKHGGFSTQVAEPVMTGQIYVEPAEDDHRRREDILEALETHEPELARILEPILDPMTKRGGGYRGMVAVWIEEIKMIRVHFHIDVRDAMGANIVNTCAEALRGKIEEITRGSVVLAIVSNRADQRIARARFSLPVRALDRGGFSGPEIARRIVRAAEIANTDPSRAVTHNKGIMNGISGLALATANDTRAIEAAVHAWAARHGHYATVTSYTIEADSLVGELEAPLPFATVGGGAGFHPAARAALKILRTESASRLSAAAAALGLAQNFAALAALTGEGIQTGHMRLHAGRIAYAAGARGEELLLLRERIAERGTYNLAAAKLLLADLRSGR